MNYIPFREFTASSTLTTLGTSPLPTPRAARLPRHRRQRPVDPVAFLAALEVLG